jgi:hypothetical protein
MSERTERSNAPQIGAFLRSINVQLDAGEPTRIAHFRPTAKAATFLEKLFLGTSPAVLATAPYGSGKSLTATYALQLVENRGDCKPTLRRLAEAVAGVSPNASNFAAKRARSHAKGLSIAIQGHAAQLPRTLCDAFLAGAARHGSVRGWSKKVQPFAQSGTSATETMLGLLDIAAEAGFDQVFLAWDEFGRHLESLITNGRPSELHDIQQLAEVASRAKKLPFRMCVLLHQGFSAYAAAAPEGVRREWKKIEERFERIEYVDDSKELLRLLVELTESMRPVDGEIPGTRQLAAQAKALQECGLFREFKHNELVPLLQRCHPLSPAALYLLPRISARVAQNERTLFNFLQAADLREHVGCDALFRYFEPAMRQDVGVGGTYRALLETNSAVAKCGSEAEAQTLQAACTLSIGLSANKTKISRNLLKETIVGPSRNIEGADRVIDSLIERKLLLYRRHSDEVSVWHGTDTNLRERIAEQIASFSGSLDLAPFLAREWPLTAVRATEHNDRFRMRRYFDRRYQQPDAAAADGFVIALTGCQGSSDGSIIHFLPSASGQGTAVDIETAKAMTRGARHFLIVSVPTEPIPLEAAAAELDAIMRLQRDRELLDADPLVAEELRQLEDDSRTHMLRLLERISSPNASARYFCDGKEVSVRAPSDLRRLVSKCCDRLYPRTPVLPNEQLNRRRPSAVVVNARKKLLAAILEAASRPDFGFHEPAFQQELGATVVAQYRALIKNTGLYREVGSDRWGFAPPAAVSDPGLAAVWQEIRAFFTDPSAQPKPFTQLLGRLTTPPYGVRPGVLPVLVACGMRAFPVVGSMTCDGQYVSDIRPSVIEDLCKDPARFALNVVAVEEEQRAYLEGVCELFRGRRVAVVDDPDLVRRAFEWIQYWKAEAPEATRVSGAVSPRTSSVRKALWSTEDPVRVLMQAVPAALEITDGNLAEALNRLKEAKTELDEVVSVYTERALKVMASAVGVANEVATGAEVLSHLQQWADAIPAKALDQVVEPRAKGVVSQLGSPGVDPVRLANMISARLTKAVTRWDDTEVARFQQEFRRIVDVVEEAAFAAAAQGIGVDSASKERLATLIQARITAQADTLIKIVGVEDAKRRLLATLPISPKPKARNQSGDLFHGTT